MEFNCARAFLVSQYHFVAETLACPSSGYRAGAVNFGLLMCVARDIEFTSG